MVSLVYLMRICFIKEWRWGKRGEVEEEDRRGIKDEEEEEEGKRRNRKIVILRMLRIRVRKKIKFKRVIMCRNYI